MGLLIAFICVSIACNVVFYFRSRCGKMEIKWNDEKQVWDASIHIPDNINYYKCRKLILYIKKK